MCVHVIVQSFVNISPKNKNKTGIFFSNTMFLQGEGGNQVPEYSTLHFIWLHDGAHSCPAIHKWAL